MAPGKINLYVNLGLGKKQQHDIAVPVSLSSEKQSCGVNESDAQKFLVRVPVLLLATHIGANSTTVQDPIVHHVATKFKTIHTKSHSVISR